MLNIAILSVLGVGLFAVAACATTSHWETGEQPPAGVDGTDRRRSPNAYHGIVKRKVITAFEGLSRGDPGAALSLMDDRVVYTFFGDHALGGTRTSKDAVTRWFSRLIRLIPSSFTILAVEVAGGLPDTRVYVRFQDTVTPAFGPSYTNHGFQTLQLRWGKVVRIATYVDTARIQAALDILARAGVDEAHAAPITR